MSNCTEHIGRKGWLFPIHLKYNIDASDILFTKRNRFFVIVAEKTKLINILRLFRNAFKGNNSVRGCLKYDSPSQASRIGFVGKMEFSVEKSERSF